MRLVFATDSLKGTISSIEAAQMLDAAARKRFPGCETHGVPMADGGEGTAEALVAACGGELVSWVVEGPLGEPVTARAGILADGRAVLEMAEAAGLTLVPEERRNPLASSTRGVGELVLRLLDAGCRDVTLTLGGSATNDGGMGMAAALGARFLDAEGNELHGMASDLGRVCSVDLSGLDGRLASCRFFALCDVDNPLVGPHGATATFGPQKGVTASQVEVLDKAMGSYASRVAEAIGRDDSSHPGAGAAGGLGFACRAFLGAELVSGIERVIRLTGLDELLEGADACVTGEGRLDAQTARGKVVAGVARACARHGVPCVALVGSADPAAGSLEGLTAVVESSPRGMQLSEALSRARELYLDAADRTMDLIATII